MGSCSTTPYFQAKDEPWRRTVEMQCLNSGAVQETAYLNIRRQALGGPSACGAIRAFEMRAAAGGAVRLRPAATLQCGMVPAIERWTREVVLPAALRHFGMPVVEYKVLSSYACRPRNGIAGGKLSEHGHANAIDIGAFKLANGYGVTVSRGWTGDPREQAFLREVRSAACRYFTTVLGPGSDRFHRDHFHLDLAKHGRSWRRACS